MEPRNVQFKFRVMFKVSWSLEMYNIFRVMFKVSWSLEMYNLNSW